jgi:hypothetical protein
MIDEAYMLSNDILFDNIDEFFEVNFIASNNSNFEEIKPGWCSGSVFGSDERWFKHKVTQETYLLVEADPPLMGEWLKIDPASPPKNSV